jgi:hypothetical protein
VGSNPTPRVLLRDSYRKLISYERGCISYNNIDTSKGTPKSRKTKEESIRNTNPHPI